MPESKVMRIQLELPESRVQTLHDLMEEAGVNTKKDLINNALAILEWAVQERRAGRTIASVDEENKKYKELVMPILQEAASRARKRI